MATHETQDDRDAREERWRGAREPDGRLSARERGRLLASARVAPDDPDAWSRTGMVQREAEEEVLGTLLADGSLGGMAARDLVGEAAAVLVPDDFYPEQHQAIFAAILEAVGQGIAPDPTYLAAALRKVEGVDLFALVQLTSRLADFTFNPRRLRRLCECVREAADRRRLLTLAVTLGQASGAPEAAPEQTLAELEATVAQLGTQMSRGRGGADTTIAAAVATYRTHLAAWRETPGELRGTTTGLRALNDVTLGAHGGDLWLIGGRMSMGKTALGLVMLLQAAFECPPGQQVGMVSLEMSQQQLVHRLAALVSGESAVQIERGEASIDWERVEDALALIEQLPLRIIDTSGAHNPANGSRGKMTPQEIRRHATAWHQEARLGLVVVDYLELVRAPAGFEKAPRDERLGQIAHELKAVASELHTPVVVLAQLNRESEASDSKIPSLASLRGSDEPAAVADVVVFPVVWDYYRKRGVKVPDEVSSKPDGFASLMVAKNRNGRIGLLDAFFLADQMRFCDYDSRSGEPLDYHGQPIRRVMMAGEWTGAVR